MLQYAYENVICMMERINATNKGWRPIIAKGDTHMKNLKDAMNANENLSLRKIAAAVEVNYGLLLKYAKAPVSGQIYDPNAINFDELEKQLIKRMGQEKYDAVDWEAMAGQEVVVKVNMPDLHIGDTFTLRNDDKRYLMVYMTSTHVCILEENSTQPRVLANNTLVASGIKDLVKANPDPTKEQA